jgi:hypothetical protein
MGERGFKRQLAQKPERRRIRVQEQIELRAIKAGDGLPKPRAVSGRRLREPPRDVGGSAGRSDAGKQRLENRYDARDERVALA